MNPYTKKYIRQTDGQDLQCGLLERPHNKLTLSERLPSLKSAEEKACHSNKTQMRQTIPNW